MDGASAVPADWAGRPGDAEASPAPPSFGESVAQHQSLVFSLAYHMLRNAALAEEIAQDVFLRLHRDFARIETGAHLVHWLRRTTMHRCLDTLRRSAGRRDVPLEDVDLPAPADNEGDPIRSRRLRRCVAELSSPARAVVVLRYQEDLEPREIAEILDVPVNTVKSRLQRALVELRGRLGVLEESGHAANRE